MQQARNAIVLVAHGSRDPRWRRPFARLRDAVRRRAAGRPVALAFMQFCRPSLSEAVRRLRSRGASNVSIVPVFFAAAGTVARDLGDAVEALRRESCGVSIRVTGALGEDGDVIGSMAAAALRLAAGRGTSRRRRAD